MLKKLAQLLRRFQMMLALLSLRLPRFDLILTWIAFAPSCIVFGILAYPRGSDKGNYIYS